MNHVTNEIVAIKTKVREKNWEVMILECQQSGISARKWCLMNGDKYRHVLRAASQTA